MVRLTLMAKRKLNLTLKSKSTSVAPVQVGVLFQVYIKLQHEKHGKSSNPKPVISYDKMSGTITVPGQNGKKLTAAVEDIRFAITDNELALKYQEANDIMATALNESIDSITMTVNDTDDSVSSTEPDELGPTR